MGIRYGGADSPESFGFRMTVEAPTGTDSTTPVEVGQLFKLGGTDADGGGYKAAALVDGEDPAEVVMIQATNRATDVVPIGVRVITGYHQIVRMVYDETDAPVLGESIETADTVTQVHGLTYADRKGYVLFVDTDALEVEVLI